MVCLQKQETKPEFSALICVFQHIFIGYLDYFQCAQAVTDKYKSYWHIYIYNSYIQTFKCLLCTNTFTTHSDRNVLIRYSIHVLHVHWEFSWWSDKHHGISHKNCFCLECTSSQKKRNEMVHGVRKKNQEVHWRMCVWNVWASPQHFVESHGRELWVSR